ncbi:D-hexose-6-phosphate mutarotase [Photobacterium sp. 2_MG-2023]|uniref:D-hexose-6-phosphate mutarotase n=1 Tax=Photobacterium sp. 2_MG-2023 TaxID=3062663 RepID=UPI0026E1FDBF|nr:D-hexose-6-phosphate mutarotase [Photobacterium sp. 2_MG-2023]MDO6579808.1 D-hexose-6-phosphate mutarotase [Photobacterium sp. 2_MG-2023]
MDLRQLPTSTVLSEHISLCRLDGVDIIRILHPECQAAISLFGGHLLSFQPQGHEDLIWMSEAADFSGKSALRGGIPVCWPWFGKVASPSHGFARSSVWELESFNDQQSHVTVTLTLHDSPKSRAIWPYRFHNRLHFEFDKTLKVQLTSTNTDQRPWLMSGALHTYLAVGDIMQTKLSGLGNEYLDGLANQQRLPTNGVLQFDDAVDRVYCRAEDTIYLEDPALFRRLRMHNHGHDSAVVWNPWQSGAAGMADMTPDGYTTMLCVESALAGQGIVLEPGQSHNLSTEICVE